MTSGKQLLVLGAGVVGLSTAVRLLEAGYKVEIWTKEMPEDTTSATAAAFWEPYLVAPADKAAAWGKTSYEMFSELAKEGVESGVAGRRLLTVYREKPEMPLWASYVSGYKELERQDVVRVLELELPAAITCGVVFDTWMVEMPKYLPFLMHQVRRLGGHTVQKAIQNVAETFESHDVVINCTGLGSRDIAGIQDMGVYPVAGQVVKIPRGTEQFIFVDMGETPDRPTYIVPRSDGTVLGGTAIKDMYNRTPDPIVTQDIIARCKQFYPHLKTDKILSQVVGLRPARHEVRLETEETSPGKILVHNYGHGGGGVTLSWGCAQEVVELVKRRVS